MSSQYLPHFSTVAFSHTADLVLASGLPPPHPHTREEITDDGREYDDSKSLLSFPLKRRSHVFGHFLHDVTTIVTMPPLRPSRNFAEIVAIYDGFRMVNSAAGRIKK